MGKHKRRTYTGTEADYKDGIPCMVCGCKHSYVIRTERIGATVRRTRQCRHCGHRFYTSESS